MVKWKFSRWMRWKASRWRVGGIAGLGPGDVEAHHAPVAVADGQLGDLQRAGRGAHGGEQRADADVPVGAARFEAGHHRLHHLVQAQPFLGVQLGGEPHLGVDHPVVVEVFSALGRHPLQGVAGLHDAHGVGEGLQVQGEVEAAGPSHHPPGQIVGVGGGQIVVAGLGRQLDHGLGPQAAVQVVVQQYLWSRSYFFDCRMDHCPNGTESERQSGDEARERHRQGQGLSSVPRGPRAKGRDRRCGARR